MEQYCMGCMRKRPDNEKICPVCGWNHLNMDRVSYALPPGVFLHDGKYLIGKVLGKDRSEIDYIGYDMSLQIKVYVKEYCPESFVSRRTETNALSWNIAEEKKNSFREQFIKETCKEAKNKKNPSIADVLDYFYQNNTAYIIMDYEEGLMSSNPENEEISQMNLPFPDEFLKPWQKPKCVSCNYDWEYGEQGPIEHIRYTEEFGRPEFFCLWCKRRYVFRYCKECGNLLDEKMKCQSCGFDIKEQPPACLRCYEPTVPICRRCKNTVFMGDRYCMICGMKMR